MIHAYASMISTLVGHVILVHTLQPLNAFEIFLLVYALSSLIVLLLALFHKGLRARILALPQAGADSFGLMLMMGFNVLMFYWSLALIGLSGVSVFTGLVTLFVVLGGVFLFGEKFDTAKILLLVASITSTVFFSFSDSVLSIGFLPMLTALGTTGSWAIIHFQMKRLSHKVDGFAFVCARAPFIFLLSMPIYLVATGFDPVWQSFIDLSYTDYAMLFVAAGLMSIVTYAFMLLATRHTDLSLIAIINSLRPLLSFFIGIAFFNESADPMKLLAGVTGIGASLGYSLYVYAANRRKSATS